MQPTPQNRTQQARFGRLKSHCITLVVDPDNRKDFVVSLYSVE